MFWRKFLKLPSPVELGWSDCNALQSREFTPDCDGYTWEDWHVTVKEMHPVRYFIAETMMDFLRYEIWFPVARPFKDAHYWLVSHLIPSRRYHKLDLRQVGGYRYGWCDVMDKMLYAWFNLLGEYFQEEPYDLTTDYTLEQIEADEGLKHQHHNLQEAKAIYNWWMVERKQEQAKYDRQLSDWCDLHKNKEARQDGREAAAHRLMRATEQAIEDKTDEMLMRLMKIRRSLWT